MNKTEWLEQQGLRKPNQRGRYSVKVIEALRQAELDGVDFSEPDYIDSSVEDQFTLQDHPKIVSIKQREEQMLWGYTEEGFKISFSLCRECSKSMIWCSCQGGILAPSYIIKLVPNQPTRLEHNETQQSDKVD